MSVSFPLNTQDIREYLPHRYPMAMVDKVLSIEPKEGIRGVKNVSINEHVLQGHFPKYPIFPGVLVLEAMAQLAGIHGFFCINQKPSDGVTFLFASAEHVKFKRQVLPGDQIILSAQFVSQRMHFLKYTCEAHVDDVLVCSAHITIAKQTIDVI